jgi:hypothetical protein
MDHKACPKKWGLTICLALSVILALAGGGIALIPGSILSWAVASRIKKPLSWGRERDPFGPDHSHGC